MFVGLEITAQSFQATPTRHYPALALAMLPALAYLITVPLNMALGLRDPDPQARLLVQTLRCLAGGFIITSLLWAAALAMLIDGRLVRAALYFALAGVFALFGIIHSPLRERADRPAAARAGAGAERVSGGDPLSDAVSLGRRVWACCCAVARPGRRTGQGQRERRSQRDAFLSGNADAAFRGPLALCLGTRASRPLL